MMINQKKAHGSGVNLRLPTTEEIAETMEKYGKSEKMDAYGDGSHTMPTKWWAAL